MSIVWRGQYRKYPCNIPPGNLCADCSARIFNQRLYAGLLSAKNNSLHEAAYTRACSHLYASTRLSCPWCSLISHAIRDIADFLIFRNSDDDDADMAYGQLPLASLDCKALSKMKIRFCKNKASTVFNNMEIHVEVTNTQGETCVLPEIRGDDTFFVELQLSSEGSISSLLQRNWGRLSADSVDWLAPAKDWLQACDGHSQCKTPKTFCPSRLIDLTDPKCPKLVDKQDIPSKNGYTYVTLSYVWGGAAQTYFLTIANKPRLHQGLETNLMSQTIKDAIHVASQLRFKYIWIDALCIIQDSPDKVKDLQQMAQIYQCSVMTIFAASSPSSAVGFLSPPRGLHDLFKPIRIPVNTGDSSQTLSILLGNTRDPSPLTDPIYSRAWTCQEQLLSPRLLLFGGNGVSWECIESCITYRGPVARMEQHLLSVSRAASNKIGNPIRAHWMQVRHDYTIRDLGYLADKLNAISAVAMEIADRTGWTYLAGLWKEYLVEDLLWCYSNPKPFWELTPKDYPKLKSERARKSVPVAPSWSWASVAEGVILGTNIKQDHQAYDFRQPYEFEISHIDLEFGEVGRFGAIKSGFIDVVGKMDDLGFRPVFKPEMMDYADIALFPDIQGSVDVKDEAAIVGYGVTDPLDVALPPHTRIQCLAVAKQVVFQNEVVEGLMLLSDTNKAFRRIGFFRVHQAHIFAPIRKQMLRIK